jgi:hypothetical protein
MIEVLSDWFYGYLSTVNYENYVATKDLLG